jgi:hypothetical protein
MLKGPGFANINYLWRFSRVSAPSRLQHNSIETNV